MGIQETTQVSIMAVQIEPHRSPVWSFSVTGPLLLLVSNSRPQTRASTTLILGGVLFSTLGRSV